MWRAEVLTPLLTTASLFKIQIFQKWNSAGNSIFFTALHDINYSTFLTATVITITAFTQSSPKSTTETRNSEQRREHYELATVAVSFSFTQTCSIFRNLDYTHYYPEYLDSRSSTWIPTIS